MENNLKKIRERAGLSQSQLAEKSGVSVRSLQSYEQGDRNIESCKKLSAICEALSCKAWELIKLPAEISEAVEELEDYNDREYSLSNLKTLYDFLLEYRIITGSGEDTSLIDMAEQFAIYTDCELDQIESDYGSVLLPFKKWAEYKKIDIEGDYEGSVYDAYQNMADKYLPDLLKIISTFTVVREDSEGTIYIWKKKLNDAADGYFSQTPDDNGNLIYPDFEMILK